MKKKLIILLVLTTFILFGLSSGCKKKFDIIGVWHITLNYVTPYPVTYTGTITFSGDKSSGTSIWNIGNFGITQGTYMVSDNDVIVTITWANNNTTTLNGSKIDDNNLSGSISETQGGTGTWIATR